MARTIKVFGMTSMASPDEARALALRPHHRQIRLIVAAETRVAAIKAFGCSEGDARHSMSVTGNDAEIAKAMSKVGQVFGSCLNYRANFVEITRKEYAPIRRPKRRSYEEIMAAAAQRETDRLARQFTVEEFQYMIEMFKSANSEIGQSIAAKAQLNLPANMRS